MPRLHGPPLSSFCDVGRRVVGAPNEEMEMGIRTAEEIARRVARAYCDCSAFPEGRINGHTKGCPVVFVAEAIQSAQREARKEGYSDGFTDGELHGIEQQDKNTHSQGYAEGVEDAAKLCEEDWKRHEIGHEFLGSAILDLLKPKPQDESEDSRGPQR